MGTSFSRKHKFSISTLHECEITETTDGGETYLVMHYLIIAQERPIVEEIKLIALLSQKDRKVATHKVAL